MLVRLAPYYCPLPFSEPKAKMTRMPMRLPGPFTVAAMLNLALYYVTASPLVPQTDNAEWVARQADKRDVGRDGSFELKMRLFDRQQRGRERELAIQTLRPQGGGPA